MIACNEKESKYICMFAYIYVCVSLNHFTVHLKLMPHYKLTVLRLKNVLLKMYIPHSLLGSKYAKKFQL